jgi:hypothetical protein
MKSIKDKTNQGVFAAIIIILATVLIVTLGGTAIWCYIHNAKSEIMTNIPAENDNFESISCGNKICDTGETLRDCPQDCQPSDIYCAKTGDSCPTAGNTCCDGYCDKSKNICVVCPPSPAPINCPEGYAVLANSDSNGCITDYSCAERMCTQKGNNCCRDYTDCGAPASCGLDSVVDMKGCDSDCKPIFECVAFTGCVKESEVTDLNSARDCCEGLVKETVYQESPPCSKLAGDCQPTPPAAYVCVRKPN